MGIVFFIWRVSEFAFFGFVYGTKFAFRALGRIVFRQGPPLPRLAGEFVTELFESLGATFVKVGQVMSSRPDIFSEEVTRPLKRLQDQEAPFDTKLIPGLVREAYGKPLEEVFVEFDFRPISAASVAHVHRARLRDGRDVAVKIRRPGQLRRVKYDLLVLKLFARVLDLLPGMYLISLPQMVDDFTSNIYRQLDFSLEAANNRRFRKNFEKLPGVKFPVLVDELCTDTILVMEFLAGLQKIGHITLSKEERQRGARAALQALYRMCFTDGFVHADMHPGNVFFREGGEFVVLDLGLITELGQEDFRNLTEFFFAMVTNDGRTCAKVVYESSPFRAKHFDAPRFEEEMAGLISKYSTARSGDFEVSGFTTELFDTQRKHGVQNRASFATTIIALIVFEGITKALDPELDFQAEGRKYFAEALGRRAQVQAAARA